MRVLLFSTFYHVASIFAAGSGSQVSQSSAQPSIRRSSGDRHITHSPKYNPGRSNNDHTQNNNNNKKRSISVSPTKPLGVDDKRVKIVGQESKRIAKRKSSDASIVDTKLEKNIVTLSEQDLLLMDYMETLEYGKTKDRSITPEKITKIQSSLGHKTRRSLQDRLPDLRKQTNTDNIKCPGSASSGCKISRPRQNHGNMASSSILVTPQGEKYLLSNIILGSGKFAITKLAQNAVTGEWVVVKISPLQATEASKEARIPASKEIDLRTRIFKTENDVLSLMGRLISSFEYNNKGYTLTNLINGVTVDQLPWNAKLKKSKTSGESQDASYLFTPEKIETIKNNLLQEIKKLRGLGIGHRDLHPGNIMVNPKSLEVSIIDFGLVEQRKDKFEHVSDMNERIAIVPLDYAKHYREKGDKIDVMKTFDLY